MLKILGPALAQATLISGVAALLAFMIPGSIHGNWDVKDYFFVIAVFAVVFVNRINWKSTELLAHRQNHEKRQKAANLERTKLLYGDPVQLCESTVTCILFFGTWCAASRKALLQFEKVYKELSNDSQILKFVALTQESNDELDMYKIKGQNAKYYKPLADFGFTIANEDGHMSKEYLVRFEFTSIPKVFVVGSDQTIAWYGDVHDKEFMNAVQQSLMDARAAKEIIADTADSSLKE